MCRETTQNVHVPHTSHISSHITRRSNISGLEYWNMDIYSVFYESESYFMYGSNRAKQDSLLLLNFGSD